MGDILKRAARADQPIPPQGPFFQLPKSLPQQFFSMDGTRPPNLGGPFDLRFAPQGPFGKEIPGTGFTGPPPGVASPFSPHLQPGPVLQFENKPPQAMGSGQLLQFPIPRVPVPDFRMIEPNLGAESYIDFLKRRYGFNII